MQQTVPKGLNADAAVGNDPEARDGNSAGIATIIHSGLPVCEKGCYLSEKVGFSEVNLAADKFERLADGLYTFEIRLWDLNIELLFERHHELDKVE